MKLSDFSHIIVVTILEPILNRYFILIGLQRNEETGLLPPKSAKTPKIGVLGSKVTPKVLFWHF